MSPGNLTKVVTLRLSPETHGYYEKMAKESGITVADVLRIILDRFRENGGSIKLTVSNLFGPGKHSK
jgi:hypothetical protein